MLKSTALRLALAAALALPLMPATVTGASAQSRCGEIWRVSPGDTLSSISRACGIPAGAIQAANPQIDWRRLAVGARVNLIVRGGLGGPSTGGPARPEAYIVRPGDTLSSIARSFGISLQALLAANPGVADRDLQVGRQIYFSGRPAGPGAPGGRPPVDRPVPRPAPIEVRVDTRDAAPGGIASVRVSGLRPGDRITVEAGPTQGRGGTDGNARADRNGEAFVDLEISGRARPAERWSYEVYGEGNRILADGSFRLAEGRPGRPGGPGRPGPERLSVTGTMSNEGAECPAIRADDGRLYTLAGGLSGFRPGDRVTVSGQIAEVSSCMQGTTIAVESIRSAR